MLGLISYARVIALVFGGSVLLSSPSFGEVQWSEKKKECDLAGIHRQFKCLLAKHSKRINSQSKLFDGFAKAFFTDYSFMGSDGISRFFANLQGKKNSGFSGYFMASHISMRVINGKQYSVQYTYQSDGKEIKLTKYTNNNGKLFKAMYHYDMQGKLLNTTEYKDSSLLQKKLYKI